MSERPFLSIGEVLDLLKDDFPDVTISKIRFLESQGLLDPERTPSGYRKFYEADVARLRWILEQQREHFLPLKVIKERIASLGRGVEPTVPADQPEPHVAAIRLAPNVSMVPTGSTTSSGNPVSSASTVSSTSTVSTGNQDRPAFSGSALSVGLTGVSMTLDELSTATGFEAADLQQLERFGLISGQAVGGQVYYDEEALVVARLAAAMAANGVEPRHLRMYKTAADREAATYEQLILPLLKQRNPAARAQAAETLAELAHLGEGLRAALVRSALRQYSG